MSHVAQRLDYKALSALRRSNIHNRSICANYARFADLKQRWIASNPEATTAEYDAAVRRFAQDCGV